MRIDELIKIAKKKGFVQMVKTAMENFDNYQDAVSVVKSLLEKKAVLLKIDVDTGDHKKLMVHCPLFNKNVHIEEVCYGCRYNPGLGRWEGKDGEYFYCTYSPGSPTDVHAWPATRGIHGPKPLPKNAGSLVDMKILGSDKVEIRRNKDSSYDLYLNGNLVVMGSRLDELEEIVNEIEKIAQIEEVKRHEDIEKEKLPDEDDLAFFNDMDKEELEEQLKLYTELAKSMVDGSIDETISLPEVMAIIEHIEKLLGRTPHDLLEQGGSSIEEIPPEEVEEIKKRMEDEYDEEEVKAIASTLYSLGVKPSQATDCMIERIATSLGFVKTSMICESAPEILERCVKRVLNENRRKGYTKSNAFAICINALRHKYPEVERWIHKKKSGVIGMDKLSFHEMGVNDLFKKLNELNEAEFILRATITDDASLARVAKRLEKIAEEKKAIKDLINLQMNMDVFSKEDEPEFSPTEIEKIDHPIAEEYRRVLASQDKIDWDSHLDVIAKIVVEKYSSLKDWPVLMIEAGKQEISNEVSVLPYSRRQEIFDTLAKKIKAELSGGKKTSKKKRCRHLNPDNTFKGGFDGCVAHFMECKGLKKENAERLCAYIGRRAGKIASVGKDEEEATEE